VYRRHNAAGYDQNMGFLRNALLLCLGFAASAPAANFDLKIESLSNALKGLTVEDRRTLDESLTLIRRGEHGLAVSRLTQLSKKNPQSAGAKVVLAYALLNAGNLLGAFGHAKDAEEAAHDSYVWLFLARVAFLTGDTAACKREIKHVQASGQHSSEVAELLEELKQNPKGGATSKR
jgi:predicted Zn-dependent protease